ncbi:spore germination protein GerPE [Paenibacillus sp. LHD-117]|uniref:spore germination protein GerPE n=1 Tax=Paenibacillus sp. LHD-117 TaxID=3071412 RepID=UPI0027E125BA|nr:spore germination protein GerPE [Paenibacillus sp. LHD-117]MDQ6421085.1 spore germination protein GerPE [Paenibacillus sp. LHD-117]
MRTSQVGMISLISLASASTVQIGDRGSTNAKLNAIAVQRKEDHSSAGEAYFESYPVFSRDWPVLRDPEFESGRALSYRRCNHSPRISVGCVSVIALSSSSSLHIGNSYSVVGEARVKHIRQFADESDLEGTSLERTTDRRR